jgi:hypothetical protein
VTREVADKISEALLTYLSSQTYQDEPLLHAIVCCDFVSRQRLAGRLSEIIEKESVDV